ncbi:DsrE family protein [Hydrogenophaga sp. XSHU_21]
MADRDEVAGIAILLWAAEPESPHRLVTPFFQAAAAAAMDTPVEMYFTARSVHLLVPGVADTLRASPGQDNTVGDALRAAVQHGVKLYACTDALHAQGIDPAQLISECAGHGGAVQFMGRVSDGRWRSLVF